MVCLHDCFGHWRNFLSLAASGQYFHFLLKQNKTNDLFTTDHILNHYIAIFRWRTVQMKSKWMFQFVSIMSWAHLIIRFLKNGWKSSKIDKNWQKSPKMAEICQKSQKMSENCRNLPKIAENCIELHMKKKLITFNAAYYHVSMRREEEFHPTYL